TPFPTTPDPQSSARSLLPTAPVAPARKTLRYIKCPPVKTKCDAHDTFGESFAAKRIPLRDKWHTRIVHVLCQRRDASRLTENRRRSSCTEQPTGCYLRRRRNHLCVGDSAYCVQ